MPQVYSVMAYLLSNSLILSLNTKSEKRKKMFAKNDSNTGVGLQSDGYFCTGPIPRQEHSPRGNVWFELWENLTEKCNAIKGKRRRISLKPGVQTF